MDIAEIRKKAKALKDMAEEAGAAEKEPPPARSEMPAEEVGEALTPEQPARIPEGVAPECEPTMADFRPEADYTGLPTGDAEPAFPVAAITPSHPEAVVGASEEPAEEKTEEAAESEIEAITFMLDNEEYAVDIHQVKEVIKTREMIEVPRAPRDIVGVISLRGVIVPVMNLRGRLGMPMKEGGERIVIVKDGPDLLGLLVDTVKQVVRVSEGGIEPPPAVNTIGGGFIKGIGRCKGAMFILLDMEKILERM